jgi:NAD(P)-dependent dehydrogenase (short-subunit alcohol dehydrogenase family)
VELLGRTALVTGAGTGIGETVALRLAARGAAVMVADIDGTAARRTCEKIGAAGRSAAFVMADVTQVTDVEKMVYAAVRTFGGLDVLVNNAGGYLEPVFPDAPLEHWSRALDLNLRSVMLATQFAVKAMAERGGGAIVNISSSAGVGLGTHPSPEYAAAKAAVMRLTAALGSLAKRRIRVTCVCPHTVATRAVLARIRELQRQGQPLPQALRGTLLTPDEVADAVLALVDDDSAAGQVIALVGGEPSQRL